MSDALFKCPACENTEVIQPKHVGESEPVCASCSVADTGVKKMVWVEDV